jgi:hypothetical protein
MAPLLRGDARKVPLGFWLVTVRSLARIRRPSPQTSGMGGSPVTA